MFYETKKSDRRCFMKRKKRSSMFYEVKKAIVDVLKKCSPMFYEAKKAFTDVL